jgi:hypothetical protein
MAAVHAVPQSEQYTRLSDRFRSLWTFYQFLGGVHKHIGQGALPFSYDFQALYRRLQALVGRVGSDEDADVQREIDTINRELDTISDRLQKLDTDFPPSSLRRFFDRLKRQDDKILFALTKFYLQSGDTSRDVLDKLDILFTRIGEAPLDDGRSLVKDRRELEAQLTGLLKWAVPPAIESTEMSVLVDATREIRSELESIRDFDTLLSGAVLDRLRNLKQRLGPSVLHSDLLIEVVSTNIAAKNRFSQLYEQEEAKILEDTNRILEIERYVEAHPDFAHDDLRDQLESFRSYRTKIDSQRKQENLKREELREFRRRINEILERFDPMTGVVRPGTGAASQPPLPPEEPNPLFEPPAPSTATADAQSSPAATPAASDTNPHLMVDEDRVEQLRPESHVKGSAVAREDEKPIDEIIPPDPLLNEALHKIMFALELVAWNHEPSAIVSAPELHNLKLEPWEVEAYIDLSRHGLVERSIEWELARFFITIAALRIKIREEIETIERLRSSYDSERFYEVLERAGRSLERAGEMDRRFQWFIDDMLYRGETRRLEEIYRSRFRLLRLYAQLWLDHQEAGGVTPL